MSPAAHATLAGVELVQSGSLTAKALTTLAEGPLPTAVVAERVMALRGNPQAAAAAVFALLGTDPRFAVDGAGTWSLRDAQPPTPTLPLLRNEEWVVVDVETTGGSPAHDHRIIEFAAVHVVNGRIAGEFASLINPGRPIPRMITSLTGIDDRSVSSAPRFDELAPRIAEALTGRIFVGHNVSFDWRFVSAELERCSGRVLQGRQFCTLRVARRLLPNLRSRSLGALAYYLGIDMTTHHRALDDAVATAKLLLHFLETLEDRGVSDWTGLERFFQTRRQRRPRRSSSPRSMDRE